MKKRLKAINKQATQAARKLSTLGVPTAANDGFRVIAKKIAAHLGVQEPATRAERNEIIVRFVEGEVYEKKEDHFYESAAWRELRYEVLKERGARCDCCGARGGVVQLHVDHIKPRSLYPKLELERSNLQVLCEDCNLGKGNRDVTDWRVTTGGSGDGERAIRSD